ncbi:MAG: ferredoxin:protochlorophyllide reductase (ATP-dependent) subunit B [Pseudomonadota bacterium]
MQLTMWTYEGPPHFGAMRVATSMEGLHFVLHAPQGDTYADLLFTMIERRKKRPPVTYTTFQARDLGKDTADLFKTSCREAYERFKPQALLVGASCTAELIQDDPGGLAKTLGIPVPVVPIELPSYTKKENWGAAETFYRLVRAFGTGRERKEGRTGSCNVLGPSAMGFRSRDDIKEVRLLLDAMGVDINVVAPLEATPADLARLCEADFNIVLYPEVAESAAAWLKREFGQPIVQCPPIGVNATKEFIQQVADCAECDPAPALEYGEERLSWYSRSVDSSYLTGKRVFVFGDATHALAAARIADTELAFKVCGLGTYSREFARDIRRAAKQYDVEPIISDDHLEIEKAIVEAQPELVLGTQMERHIAKRLRIPCAVISAPFHVQDVPARYAPQMGFEGANNIFDSWVHPLTMGLEEHLLGMFRDDFEFNDDVRASHLQSVKPIKIEAEAEAVAEENPDAEEADTATWSDEAQQELKKIPFFVRGKARRNTEIYAVERGVTLITLETLYDAKAHFAR